jgi:RNA polymerase sigma factor (sigma-70 family)
MHIIQDDRAEDELLLLQLKEGNEQAFDHLYDKYWQQVYAAAFKRLQDPARAKDITQDIFLQLWLKRMEKGIGNLPAYLSVAVRNNVWKLMRKEERYTPIPELLFNLGAMDRTDAELLRGEFEKAYEALVDALTPAQQTIFRMRYHEDMSTSLIAGELEISRKTVQNQLRLAVAHLRASLTLILLLFLLFRP